MNGFARRATYHRVTSSAGQIEGAEDHWRSIRADEDIQFANVEIPPPEPPPEWLLELGRFLAELFAPLAQFFGSSWFIVKWVLLALAALGIVLLLWRILAPMMGLTLKRKSDADEPVGEWTPDRSDAVALLEDADRLAREGRFDEATHLLLQRSVDHIATARPDWLDPSSTAREIALIPWLPDRARDAFSAISTRVERSLFALRPLDARDWQAARDAYSDFALADLRGQELAA